jgi:hypothetical protein
MLTVQPLRLAAQMQSGILGYRRYSGSTDMPKDIDLCILALVQQGLATPFDLKVKAGLSLGTTIPTLNRLCDDEGLLKATQKDTHRSRRYSPSNKGNAALRAQWPDLMRSVPTDIDSILRIAYVAWLFGDPQKSTEYVEKGARQLQALAEARAAEARSVLPEPGQTPRPEHFLWFRLSAEARRLDADAATLAEVAKQIRGKKKRGKTR